MWKLQHRIYNVRRERELRKSIYVGYGTWNSKHHVHGFTRKRGIHDIIWDLWYVDHNHTGRGEIKLKREQRNFMECPTFIWERMLRHLVCCRTSGWMVGVTLRKKLRLIYWRARYRLELDIHETLLLKTWCITNSWKFPVKIKHITDGK